MTSHLNNRGEDIIKKIIQYNLDHPELKLPRKKDVLVRKEIDEFLDWKSVLNAQQEIGKCTHTEAYLHDISQYWGQRKKTPGDHLGFQNKKKIADKNLEVGVSS